MVTRDVLTSFLDSYLSIQDIDDNSWNGLQFEGKDSIQTVAFAVDAGIDTFRQAAEQKADFLIVHHGQFWKSNNPSITSWNKQRISHLYDNAISLYAAHLPLDRHPEVGNNAQLLTILDAKITEEFMDHHGKNVGWIGERKNAITLQEVEQILTKTIKASCTILPFGKKEIKTIAVCSGGGGYAGYSEAQQKGVDLYISGDSIEIYLTAKDAGMNVIFAGHHATETVGLKALQKVIEEKFSDIKTTFIDIPTGL